MLKTTVVVSLLALAGSVVSFANQVVLAWAFGAGREMDSYLLAISLPFTILGLIAGVLGYLLVPALQREQVQVGSTGPLLRALLLWMGGAAAAVAIIGWLTAGFTVAMMNPNLDVLQGRLTVGLSRVAWLTLPFAVVVAVYTAGLHVRRQFYLVALIQPLPALTTLLALLLFHHRRGIYAPIWGQLVGYVICALALKAVSPTSGERVDRSQQALMLFRRLPLAVAAIAIFVLYPLSDALWGSRIGPAVVSYLGYAQRLLVGISGIAVVGATTVLFPRFSEQAANGNEKGMLGELAASMRVMLICMAPAAVFFMTIAVPVVQILFGRGVFGTQQVHALASIMPAMLCGMVAMSCGGLVFKAIFACNKIWGAVTISLAGSTLYWSLSGVLAHFLGLHGIAIAYAFTWWTVLGGGIVVLWGSDALQGLIAPSIGFVARLILACTVVAGVGLACDSAYAWLGSPSMIGRVCFLTTSSLAVGAIYLYVCVVILRMADARTIVRLLMRKPAFDGVPVARTI